MLYQLILRLSRLLLLFAVLIFPVSLQAQHKHALLVGISEYPQYSDKDATWSQIHGTNDVNLIAPLLSRQGFRVRTLLNKKSTHKAIINELKGLAGKVREGEIVYIHLSGHGQAVDDMDGDETDGWDEAFVPYDAERSYQKDRYKGENHLLDDELNIYLNDIRKKIGATGIVYVVIDACHAGSSYRGDDDDSIHVRGTDIGFSKTGRSYTPKIDKRGNIRVPSGEGLAPVYMMEACRSYEVNAEIKQDGKYYGPMSYYISRQLLTSSLSFDTKWIEEVRKNMDKDIRLVRQHLVTETSE